jgi:TetR/AcrR family transcriptional regulator, transcriptional repressor for nem operon
MSDGEVPVVISLTRKGQETRQRIVGAAADLIFERGVTDFSLESLRDATGTSSSQIYHYFNDKSDLVHAVIELQQDRVLGAHGPTFAALESLDDLQTWRDMIVAMQAARSCRNGCPLGSLVSGVVESDAIAREQLNVAFAQWVDLISDGLRRMVDSGLLRSDANPGDLAVSILASLQGGLLMAETERETRSLEIALDSALAYVRSFATIPGQ